MPGHRCTKLASQARCTSVIRQMSAGVPRPQIVENLVAQEGISRNQALQYMRKADLEICEAYSSSDRAAILGQLLHASERALQIALKREMPFEIVAAVRTLDQLLALGASHELQKNRPWENR